MYIMFMNRHPSRKFYKKNLIYINGFPCTHGDNIGFINNCRCSLFNSKYLFEEHSNDKELFMKRKASRFIVVHATHSMSPSD
jgi:hypothetical protein